MREKGGREGNGLATEGACCLQMDVAACLRVPEPRPTLLARHSVSHHTLPGNCSTESGNKYWSPGTREYSKQYEVVMGLDVERMRK